MSTKIYQAWRIPARRLNEFIDIVDPQMFKAVLDRVERTMSRVKVAAVEERFVEIYGDVTSKRREGVNVEEVMEAIRCDIVLDFSRDPAVRMSGMTLDCGLSIWEYRRHCYIIPYGVGEFTGAIEPPEWADDYGYWNNTDRPDTMSRRAWTARANTWEKVALNQWDAHRLTHNVVDMDPCNYSTSRSRIYLHFMRNEGTE